MRGRERMLDVGPLAPNMAFGVAGTATLAAE